MAPGSGKTILYVLGLLWVGLTGGCAFRAFEIPAGPPRHELAVPFFPQEIHHCGPAALASALVWSGVETTPQALAPAVFTPGRQGSFQSELLGTARRHGRIAYPLARPTDLFREISGGTPVVVLLNLGLSWAPRWHYAVVIGYDPAAEEIILHSGTTPRMPMDLTLFRRTWARGDYWGITVLKPGEMPVVVQQQRYLESVLGLERAGHYSAAAVGYQQALRYWSDSLIAWMGLGNSRYQLRQFARAEAAFRGALKRHPKSANAYNNLAMTLLAKGEIEAARRAARQAVALGGPLVAEYQRTLAEIEAAQAP